ncbi:MAG: ABC transporter ATP-binding protein [Thiobacillaceae bacterium]
MSLLHVENLVVRIGNVTPVDDVSLDIGAGETLALLGESGCGKSMTALALMRLLPHGGQIAAGRVQFDGHDVLALPEYLVRRLRGRGMAMIFQEPQTSLNPVMTIGEQIAEALPSDLPRAQVRAEVLRLLEEVGIPDAARRISCYPFELSGGQKQRAMIAQALAGNPKLLIADEPTTALDVTLQAQILDLIKRLTRERRMGLLLITHDLGVAAKMADQIGVMYAGQLVETGASRTVLDAPFHPYTQKLMAAVPGLARVGQRLAAIPGRVPPLNQRFTTCRFADRCEQVFTQCRLSEPPLKLLASGHRVRCCLTQRADSSAAQPAVIARSERSDESRTVLDVQDLHVTYTMKARGLFGRSAIRAVDGISFTIPAGKTLALVGESGCGKTTAAKAILALCPIASGRVRLNGETVSGLSGHQFKPHRRIAQIVFQDPYSSLNPRMRVGEILTEGMGALGIRNRKSLAELLGQVGLDSKAADRYPHEFSGGQRQRIAIARTLAVEPKLLICDEPTSALDVSVQAQILNLLADLQREHGLAMLFITHNLAAVGYLAHRVAVMKEGKIVEEGETSQILTQPKQDYTRALLAAAL